MVDNISGDHMTRLFLLCGKAGSGKSTLARQLSDQPRTVLIEEDEWLARLYPDEIKGITDYVRATGRVREVLADLIVGLLRQGTSVVLDFPANTRSYRLWARTLAEQAGVPHELHYLDVDDATCRARLRARNAAGSHPFTVSDEAFDQITQYFVPPQRDEELTVIRREC